MRKLFLFVVVAAATAFASAQVKVGDNPTTINSSAVLEIESATKGLLLPRVALKQTATAEPLAAHVGGMTVYNTATAGDVTPGYYYNDGNKWVRLATDVSAWLLNGNNGVSATNFLGSINDMPLIFKANGTQSGYLSTANIGKKNTAFGYNSLPAASTTQATGNTAIGNLAMNSFVAGATGKETFGSNTAVGFGAMQNITNGSFSTAVGSGALGVTTQSWNNTAVGVGTLAKASGSLNTAVGGSALNETTTGNANTAIGLTAMQKNQTGSGNIAIGRSAGDNITTGSYNIVLGNNSTVPDAAGAGQLNIAGLIVGTGLGGSDMWGPQVTAPQRVGIAQQGNAITETFDVNGNTRLRTLPENNQTNATYTKPDGTASAAKDQTYVHDKMLVVDKNGVVGKANIPPSGNFDFFGQQTETVSNYHPTQVYKIPVKNEIFDPKGEFDPTTQIFTPSKSGMYLFDVTVNIRNAQGGDATLITNCARVGIVDNATNAFVSYVDLVSSGTNQKSITQSSRVIVFLELGKSYYFGTRKTPAISGISEGYGMILDPDNTMAAASTRSNTIFALKLVEPQQ